MSRAEHPVIGINGQRTPGENPKVTLADSYANAVLKAGGVPIVLAPVGGPGDLPRLLEAVDGVLLSGADDFDTERLGLGPTHPEATPVPSEKQDWDFALAQAVLEREMPVLGICYGMQLLALCEGGTLHQHVPTDLPGSRSHAGGVRHDVLLDEESKLARLFGVERVETVSRHHQAVAAPGPAWRVAARDDEDLIEAIEREGHPFAIGVQWHPELDVEGSPQDRLFRAFVGAAGVAAMRRDFSPGAHAAASQST